MKWYAAAAEQGHSGAQNRLGVMYAEGQGAARDYGKAVQWYQRAAEQGDAAAQYNLGMVYAQGQGVPRDNARAYFWYNLAAMELVAMPPSAAMKRPTSSALPRWPSSRTRRWPGNPSADCRLHSRHQALPSRSAFYAGRLPPWFKSWLECRIQRRSIRLPGQRCAADDF
jgi:TPR repeat protein